MLFGWYKVVWHFNVSIQGFHGNEHEFVIIILPKRRKQFFFCFLFPSSSNRLRYSIEFRYESRKVTKIRQLHRWKKYWLNKFVPYCTELKSNTGMSRSGNRMATYGVFRISIITLALQSIKLNDNFWGIFELRNGTSI